MLLDSRSGREKFWTEQQQTISNYMMRVATHRTVVSSFMLLNYVCMLLPSNSYCMQLCDT
jgi:hypothetical protein